MMTEISVRALVEFICRCGDIDSTRVSKGDMQLGTQIHRMLQKQAGESYRAEVRLEHTFTYGDINIRVRGIADGIDGEGEDTVIEEIKTTAASVDDITDENKVHWAQGMFYAYIYAQQNGLSLISVRLLYCNSETYKTKSFQRRFSLDELAEFTDKICRDYARFAEMEQKHKEKRNDALLKAAFPFPSFRKGQRELAGSVYTAVRNKKTILIQAPTGIGKTASTMFPALKAMGEGKCEKLFYLTAKTVSRTVAENTFLRIRDSLSYEDDISAQFEDSLRPFGVPLSCITITAKDKTCIFDKSNCDPAVCPRAKGHFDRINGAIADAAANETYFCRETVEAYAQKHCVCPFELSLDLSERCDIVICDCNYVFDPQAHLKRYFDDDAKGYSVLVDEAHNLPERAREMFSAEVTKEMFTPFVRILKPHAKQLSKAFSAVNSWFINKRHELGDGGDIVTAVPDSELCSCMERLSFALSDFFESSRDEQIKSQLLDTFFAVRTFMLVLELYSDRYVTHTRMQNGTVCVTLYCVDPSENISRVCGGLGGTVFFSATLLPADYFRQMLTTEQVDFYRFASPFPKDNLCLLVADDVSARYKDRQRSFRRIIDYIHTAISCRRGNYMVFFPSFEYMNEVAEQFRLAYPDVYTVTQNAGMSEREREQFLARFENEPTQTMVAFVVLGGIFAESIDLTGERLSGAVIVSPGLPQLCMERDIIRDHFDERGDSGFKNAYMYPGMNRVLQAAGRVIRTEYDRGFVLLLDDRFASREYTRTFPPEWHHGLIVHNVEMAKKLLDEFWRKDME